LRIKDRVIAVCKNPNIPCNFRRWSRINRSVWMLPFCKWNGTCNLKYEVSIAHTDDDELIKSLRVHISKGEAVAKVQPLW